MSNTVDLSYLKERKWDNYSFGKEAMDMTDKICLWFLRGLIVLAAVLAIISSV